MARESGSWSHSEAPDPSCEVATHRHTCRADRNANAHRSALPRRRIARPWRRTRRNETNAIRQCAAVSGTLQLVWVACSVNGPDQVVFVATCSDLPNLHGHPAWVVCRPEQVSTLDLRMCLSAPALHRQLTRHLSLCRKDEDRLPHVAKYVATATHRHEPDSELIGQSGTFLTLHARCPPSRARDGRTVWRRPYSCGRQFCSAGPFPIGDIGLGRNGQT